MKRGRGEPGEREDQVERAWRQAAAGEPRGQIELEIKLGTMREGRFVANVGAEAFERLENAFTGNARKKTDEKKDFFFFLFSHF